MGFSQVKNFPAKKKIRALILCMLQFLFFFCFFLLVILLVTSVQMCSIFPPKKLEKIQRPKYTCANFFFLLLDILPTANKLHLYFLVVFLYCYW